jgi:hypothetical protein
LYVSIFYFKLRRSWQRDTSKKDKRKYAKRRRSVRQLFLAILVSWPITHYALKDLSPPRNSHFVGSPLPFVELGFLFESTQFGRAKKFFS